MVVLRASGDSEADHDLREKGVAPGLREVVGDVEGQRIAALIQGCILLMEITHPSIRIGHSRPNDVA